MISATNAITAYKNLAERGYNDSQIKQVMNALKDASAYGRQSSMTMGEAVESATEGLKNENSILVDNAGVTMNLANLLKVKTLVTLLLTIVFCALALTGVISGADFLTVFTVVIAFYFGTQSEKQTANVTGNPPAEGETVQPAADTEQKKATVDAAVNNEVNPPDTDITVTG